MEYKLNFLMYCSTECACINTRLSSCRVFQVYVSAVKFFWCATRDLLGFIFYLLFLFNLLRYRFNYCYYRSKFGMELKSVKL